MQPRAAENRQLVTRYFELLNEGHFSSAHEIISADVVFVGPRAPEGIRGLHAFKEFIASLRHDSPDLRFEEVESLAEADGVASVFTMTRTHHSQQGQARRVVTEGMDLFHIADGRIWRINSYFDRLALLIELEMIPALQL